MTSVETVGVDPDVGGFVTKGAGVGGMVLQTSVYSQLPFKKDPLPKLALQHPMTELYEEVSAMKNSLEHVVPSKKKT